MRNIGGSIGISIVVATLAENTQIVHSRLIESLRPDNPLAQAPFLAPNFSLFETGGMAALNAEVTRQAAMVAYINDFKLLMILALAALPLLLLLRPARGADVRLDAARRRKGDDRASPGRRLADAAGQRRHARAGRQRPERPEPAVPVPRHRAHEQGRRRADRTGTARRGDQPRLGE